MPDRGPKVFGIGFHKTATSSLAQALALLGYVVTGPNLVRHPQIAQVAPGLVHHLVPRFDAFQDNPWPMLFRQVDKAWPGSRFILTLRDEADWLRSALRHFGSDETPMRRWIYGAGAPRGNEKVYLARYRRHNQEVLAHFRDRPEDLLVMDIGAGNGWRPLCGFLGHCVPEGAAFPHANSARARETGTRA